MSDLILHHYALSPFSEKVRAMLGYAGLDWQSVTVREMPPRPQLAPLAGGYRKIPVAQSGADVFCDTRIISQEIARLANKPELVADNCDAQVQEFVARVDLDIFLACIISAGNLTLLRKVLKESSLLDLGRLLWDRIAMGSKAKVKTNSPKQMKRMVEAHLTDLEGKLESQSFLFGDSPNAGDFSAYHSLWFQRDLAEQPRFKRYPKVNAWLDRLQAYEQGNSTPISADQALEQARAASPRDLPDSTQDQALLGKIVSVAPNDYGRIPVEGTLVASTDERWIVARDEDAVGRVHVHLPRQGFVIRAV
ncbi:MAG: glutathione S-transferase family protein [Alcanivorax sp.]|jgi:glutathione S-transferase|uniref:glutathione S-transferase family protein n=1 Tax=Alcanivorax sp. TaxID=1872427 RepID=UPI003C66DFBA